MRLLDPRKIDVAFKAETLVEWDMADANFGWHRLATTEQYKLGVVQGRVIMLIHPTVVLKTAEDSDREFMQKRYGEPIKRGRGRRK
uniref:Uncharacterized protein n=1 Tax=viral metagenome TaxID=1070528 RepID=A0A6M3LS81_9ZZZZ